MQSPGSERAASATPELAARQEAQQGARQHDRQQSDREARQQMRARWHSAPRGQGLPLARFLGWFSIGLGLVELVAPRQVARGSGVAGGKGLVRAMGVREIASGVGILSRRQPSTWLWSRVGGDAMDLALLGSGAMRAGRQRKRAALVAAAVAGIAVLDVMASVQQTRRERKQGPQGANGDLYIETSIAVNKSPRECYDFWRDFENLPRFMEHLEEVQVLDTRRSHWKAHAPAGMSVEWDAEVTADTPGEMLAWHSLPGASVENAGTVRFEPGFGGRGTLLRVELQYQPPMGMAGAAVATLFSEEPSQQIADDLRRFKWLIETGEIPTTVGQSAGPRSLVGRLFRKGMPG